MGETLSHHTNRKALEEGGWAVETIVDHLLAEGFSADRINIGYAGYTRNARQVEIESLSPLKGSYNPRFRRYYRFLRIRHQRMV